eukprot:6092921-Pyramimonas_sp.AAC.1
MEGVWRGSEGVPIGESAGIFLHGTVSLASIRTVPPTRGSLRSSPAAAPKRAAVVATVNAARLAPVTSPAWMLRPTTAAAATW